MQASPSVVSREGERKREGKVERRSSSLEARWGPIGNEGGGIHRPSISRAAIIEIASVSRVCFLICRAPAEYKSRVCPIERRRAPLPIDRSPRRIELGVTLAPLAAPLSISLGVSLTSICLGVT